MNNLIKYTQIERMRKNLFSAVGTSSALLRQLEEGEMYEEAKLIKEQINSVNRALSETINFIEYKKYDSLNPVLFNIEALVCDVARITRSKIRKTSITVNLSTDKHKAFVICDPERAANCLFNIIANALSNVALDEGVINISVKSGSNDVKISVSDNGYGMTVDEASKKFKEENTVGGFAILKKFAESCGASVIFETAEYGGFSIFIKIPLAKEPYDCKATDFEVESGALTDADMILGKFDYSITKPID